MQSPRFARRAATYLAALATVFATSALAGCAVDTSPAADDETVSGGEDALVAKADDEWFYGGPLPALESPSIVVSLKGNTARVTGYLPAGTELPELPHVRTKAEGTRTKIDVVYPIATAMPGKSNSRPGTYSFYEAKPYRPDGPAYTRSLGWHSVPWGGFPFLAYNEGIAFHGPITSEDNKGAPDVSVWYLRRGRVSSGCNRMMGEHVIELAHILGISMHKLYGPNQSYRPTTTAKVRIIDDYDTYEGKAIDVDYPTDTGVTRPGVALGTDEVTMFGSWVASLMPDGRDLPPDMKWEGGVRDKPYVFSEHVREGMVCSVAKRDLPALKRLAASMGGELPSSFCAKKDCVVSALRSGADARATCAL